MFEGASPSVNTILCELKDEHGLWCMAGAKKLQGLGLTFAIYRAVESCVLAMCKSFESV